MLGKVFDLFRIKTQQSNNQTQYTKKFVCLITKCKCALKLLRAIYSKTNDKKATQFHEKYNSN